jgi:hypothetical protein
LIGGADVADRQVLDLVQLEAAELPSLSDLRHLVAG